MDNPAAEAARIGVPLQFLLDNLVYHQRYGLRKDHFDKAERIRAVLEADGDVPRDGDLVKAVGSRTYDGAHLQFTGWKGTTLCTQPTTPYIDEKGSTSASGGYWITVRRDHLRRDEENPVGEKTFWTWGDNPRERGDIKFRATVRRWVYSSKNIY